MNGRTGGEDRTPQPARLTERANRAVMLACLAFVVSMVGMSYAAVPLYRIFCQATGYGGTPRQVAEASHSVIDRTVKVRFDANTAPGLEWDFAPAQPEVVVRLGETVKVAYRATNRSARLVRARATFNVTPDAAGAFFSKVDCFCFVESTLKPGETAELPIVFFVDPAYVGSKELKTTRTLTLSYTFFPLEDASRDKVGEGEKKI